MSRSNGEGMREQAQSGISRMSDTAHQAVNRASEVAQQTADRLSARGQEWMSSGNEWMENTRVYVREHPMASVGMAIAAGYLLSRIFARD
jgi:ElaB/YqjD/DUF883 family membrane-anchored ribosome-binding protein